jgi:hypothetical protein
MGSRNAQRRDQHGDAPQHEDRPTDREEPTHQDEAMLVKQDHKEPHRQQDHA